MTTTSPVNPPIVVMGVCGSGKTTLAKALSAHFGAAFVEADDHHTPQAKAKMSSNVPLTDEDRLPWLEGIAREMNRLSSPAIAACSALKRSYRDHLRARVEGLTFLHLAGSRELLAQRLAARKGHFVGAGLLDSQLEILQPLSKDEPGLTLDFSEPLDALTDRALRFLATSNAASNEAIALNAHRDLHRKHI